MSKHRTQLIVSLLAVMTALSAVEANAATAGGGVPRVVVTILIDQLRSDYLKAFQPLYGEDGFAKLLEEGRVYANAEYPHTRPDLASSAATVATGTTPSNHGIIGRKWMDRATLRPAYCVDDADYAGLQTDEKISPHHLATSTFGDELKIATEGKALVYSIAPCRESAVMQGGHAADAVIWIDDATGRWCSSTYYSPSLPSWVSVLNSGTTLAERLNAETWQPSSELVGNFSYFLSGGMKSPFKHSFKKGISRFASFKTSGLVNEEIAAAVEQCLGGTMLGADGVTDLLNVTFYAGNFEHKPVSEVSMEVQDTYVRLDRTLARLIKAIDGKVGRDNALYVLTSTGYVDEEPINPGKYRIPTGTFDMQRAAALLNMYLVAVYGQGNFVEACLGTQIYLNHKLVEDKQINFTELLERTQDFLLQLSGVKDVYTAQRLLQGAWTPGISRIRGGYNAKFSGDVLIEVSPGWRYVNAETKEDMPVRESYIPFPIIFFGAGVKGEQVETPVTTDRIAPTLSRSVRIRAPNACAAVPLF